MAENPDPKLVAAQFDTQLAALKEAASKSVDPCLVAKLIAMVDPRVSELFLRKFTAGYLFRGIYCDDRVSIPENKYVVFDFDCIPGTLCLVPPAFMVVVNIVDRYVVAIVDPYIRTSFTAEGKSDCGCGESKAQAPLARTRSTCIDVTISDGQACLDVPFAGHVCVSVPSNIPNGTVAEACIDTCKKIGILCGVEVTLKVAGIEVASRSWGCC